jgi:hypothetical protein
VDDLIAFKAAQPSASFKKNENLHPKERKSTKNLKGGGIFSLDLLDGSGGQVENGGLKPHDAAIFEKIQAKINRMNALYDERLSRFGKLIEMKLDRDAFNKFETRYQDESQANIENIASLSSL